jgi:hypothetical protein
MASGAEERIEQNNRLFREANERIRSRSSEFRDPIDRIPFLCECADEGCATVVQMTSEEYQAVRDDPLQFFTAGGHEGAEKPVARVVSRTDGYVVVKKDSRQ